MPLTYHRWWLPGQVRQNLVDVGMSSERRPGTGARRLLVPVVATGVVLALLALFFYGLTTNRLPTGVDPRPNALAPDFQLSTFDGKSLRLADLRGQVVVLNFWASWCVPCREEQPSLVSTAQRYQNRGVTFVGINIQDNSHDATGFIRQYNIGYPVVSDPTGAVYINYGVVGMPETYVVTRDGRIAQKLIGPVDPAVLAMTLEKVLG
jgi:cytochrome c biogenesis protein CcmG, thiol:disulfide interchange protein DsbE